MRKQAADEDMMVVLNAALNCVPASCVSWDSTGTVALIVDLARTCEFLAFTRAGFIAADPEIPLIAAISSFGSTVTVPFDDGCFSVQHASLRALPHQQLMSVWRVEITLWLECLLFRLTGGAVCGCVCVFVDDGDGAFVVDSKPDMPSKLANALHTMDAVTAVWDSRREWLLALDCDMVLMTVDSFIPEDAPELPASYPPEFPRAIALLRTLGMTVLRFESRLMVQCGEFITKTLGLRTPAAPPLDIADGDSEDISMEPSHAAASASADIPPYIVKPADVTAYISGALVQLAVSGCVRSLVNVPHTFVAEEGREDQEAAAVTEATRRLAVGENSAAGAPGAAAVPLRRMVLRSQLLVPVKEFESGQTIAPFVWYMDQPYREVKPLFTIRGLSCYYGTEQLKDSDTPQSPSLRLDLECQVFALPIVHRPLVDTIFMFGEEQVRITWYTDQPLREVRHQIPGLAVPVGGRFMADDETPAQLRFASLSCVKLVADPAAGVAGCPPFVSFVCADDTAPKIDAVWSADQPLSTLQSQLGSLRVWHMDSFVPSYVTPRMLRLTGPAELRYPASTGSGTVMLKVRPLVGNEREFQCGQDESMESIKARLAVSAVGSACCCHCYCCCFHAFAR